MGAEALIMTTGALLADAVIGDPPALYRRLPHPVVWIGALIRKLDLTLNVESASQGRRRAAGFIALLLLLIVVGLAAISVHFVLAQFRMELFVEILLSSTLLAQRSLYEHVEAVDKALAATGLESGRVALSRIVGRDVRSLDDAAIRRATIESLAENLSDGVVAPAFWSALLGLPGLALYKAINTADSMIGHRTSRHEAFGWAAARLDDLVNLIPARLTGALIAVASGQAMTASWCVMRRDARRHRSPNAGWPEAAMAGALGIRLSGPRTYGARPSDEPWLNASGRDPGPADCKAALRLMRRACILLIALLSALALPIALRHGI